MADTNSGVPAPGGQGGAGGNAGGNPGGGAPGGGGTPPWYGTISDEHKGFIESKGWDGIGTVVDSYKNLEKFMGVPKERLLKLPDKPDSPEWGEIHGRLGRPEKPDGYEVKPLEGAPGSAEFVKWAREQFHTLGLSKTQGETLAAKWNEYQGQVRAQADEQSVTESHQQLSKLKQEWGAAFEEKVGQNRQFLEAVGVKPDQVQLLEIAFGVDGAAKLVDGIITKFGIQLGEPNFRGGGSGNGFGALTPSMAMAKKEQLLTDPAWKEKYLSGSKEHIEQLLRVEEAILAGRQG
jgi:hypothetical protein